MLEKVLVLGGGGFVSGAFTKALVDRGFRTWTLSRGYKNIPYGAVNLKADRKDAISMTSAVGRAKTNWDYVFDFSGYMPAYVRSSTSIFSRITQHYVFISSDLVYDHRRRSVPHNEEATAFASAGYGYQKRISERIVIDLQELGVYWTIFRPCHIYGPGSLLGCFPKHLRDRDLIRRLKGGQPIYLVDGGYFLQQPLYIEDFVNLLIGVITNPRSKNELFLAAGPTIIRSSDYYRIIASLMSYPVKIIDVSAAEFLAINPENAHYLCHRVYSLSKLNKCGLPVPETSIREGLKCHLKSLINK